MGIYYAAPLLGPSLGPIIGGILTEIFSWRATFYFLAIFGGVSLFAFIVFRDTFRRERSLSYQAALRQVIKAKRGSAKNSHPEEATTDAEKRSADNGTRLEDPDALYAEIDSLKVGLRHMQIIRPTIQVLRRINNVLILSASGTTSLTKMCLLLTERYKV